MAQVAIKVGDRSHVVACAAGGEARLAQLGEMLDARWDNARRAAGTGGGERELLLIALMLADDLDEALNRPPPTDVLDEAGLEKLAVRLERLAETLESGASNA